MVANPIQACPKLSSASASGPVYAIRISEFNLPVAAGVVNFFGGKTGKNPPQTADEAACNRGDMFQATKQQCRPLFTGR
jgi:hypothetical protein